MLVSPCPSLIYVIISFRSPTLMWWGCYDCSLLHEKERERKSKRKRGRQSALPFFPFALSTAHVSLSLLMVITFSPLPFLSSSSHPLLALEWVFRVFNWHQQNTGHWSIAFGEREREKLSPLAVEARFCSSWQWICMYSFLYSQLYSSNCERIEQNTTAVKDREGKSLCDENVWVCVLCFAHLLALSPTMCIWVQLHSQCTKVITEDLLEGGTNINFKYNSELDPNLRTDALCVCVSFNRTVVERAQSAKERRFLTHRNRQHTHTQTLTLQAFHLLVYINCVHKG